jgi:hypothetical protein
MNKPCRLLLSLLAIALALPGLAKASDLIPMGTDCWHTENGTEVTLTLPANFFGAGSRAIPHVTIRLKSLPLTVDEAKRCGCQVDTQIVYVDPHGNVSGERTIHAVAQRTIETTDVDTCVRRTRNARFRGRGRAVRVDIQLVQLSLQSEQPLVVTYKDGSTKSFNVFVTESGSQDPGTMTFTPRTIAALSNGEVRLGRLPVRYTVTFREVGGTAEFTLSPPRPLRLTNGPRPGTFAQLAVP